MRGDGRRLSIALLHVTLPLSVCRNPAAYGHVAQSSFARYAPGDHGSDECPAGIKLGSVCGMDVLPDDGAARRASLEGWAAVQQRRMDPPSRTRLALLRVQRQLASGSQRFANRVLDRGLDTSGSVTEPEHAHPDRVRYVPSAWHVLPRALRYLGVSDLDTFVDFGCGKGRVVHQAARWPFRRVIGVEISPVLAEIARTNLAARRHKHRCRNVEIVVSDVTEFRVPDDLTTGYLFQPFKNETLDAVLRGIVDSIDRHPRRVRLIYVCPLNASQVLATGRFRLLKEQSERNRLLDPPWTVWQTAIFESR
jgi:SAM-dependent methyltransferase